MLLGTVNGEGPVKLVLRGARGGIPLLFKTPVACTAADAAEEPLPFAASTFPELGLPEGTFRATVFVADDPAANWAPPRAIGMGSADAGGAATSPADTLDAIDGLLSTASEGLAPPSWGTCLLELIGSATDFAVALGERGSSSFFLRLSLKDLSSLT